MRRALSAASALAVAATLPILASPAQATPDSPRFAPASDGHASATQQEDNRLHPLAARQSRLRQAAVGKLTSGEARLAGKGTNRTIQLANGTKVDYPVTQTAQLLTFLVEFGGTGDEETRGPLAGEIPQPEASDNSTYWKDPAEGGFDRQHYLDMFFNGMEEQDGESFRDFYQEMSSGRFQLEGDVSDWVQVDRPEAYYGANDDAGNEDPERMSDFVQDGANAWYDAQLADMDADEIKAYLASFDTWDRYDADHDGNYNEPDGYIDHFQAIHAGAGEEAGAPPWTIWSQRSGASYWTDTGPEETPDCGACTHQGGVEIGDSGYYILDYTTEPENGGLGVFAHEFGHDLGLPDYYDTQGGDNGTGFWNLMSAGSWLGHGDGTIGNTPGHMAATDKYYLGWYGPRKADGSYDDLAVVNGLADDPTAVTLGPSYHATTTGKQAVLVSLPDGEQADGPFAGSLDGAYLYSGLHDASTVGADSPPVTIPSGGGATLAARVAYQIEPGFDYAFLRASTDGGDHWTDVPTTLSVDPEHADPSNGDDFDLGITGTSGAAPAPDDPWWWPTPSWVSLHADLSDYAGQTIRLRWEYYTDPRTNGAGFAVDDMTIGGLSSAFTSVANWDLGGFHHVVDDEYDIQYPRYYLAENRQYSGYDATLETGPYSWDYLNTAYNRVDQFPYQDGLLVWYANGLYADNNTGVHPGAGAALPVDAAPEFQLWEDQSGTPSSLVDGRLQTYDSTFDVDQTDALQLTREVPESDDIETLDVPSRPSTPVFDDSDPTAYLDDSVPPFSLWYSTRVAGAGAMIQVVSSDESTGTMQLNIGKRFVAATSKPAIDGDHHPGDTLTATAPSWYQSGVNDALTWLRDGEPFENDGTTYEIESTDVGHQISVSYTGTKSGYTTTTVESEKVTATNPAPTPDEPPAVSGTPQVGQTLTAHAGTWPIAGESSFAWSVNGKRSGIGTTYVIQPADLGQQVTLTETFASPGYDDATASTTSATVIKGSAPHATTGPTITGTAKVDETLSAHAATWPITGQSTFVWSIAGTQVGTGSTYAVKAGDLGQKVTLTETFTSPGFDDASTAVDSAAVAPGAPTATSAPRITGTARVGQTLKAAGAAWSVAGTSTFAWSVGGKSAGTGTSYAVKPADAGKKVTVTETFTSPGYATATASATSGAVAKAAVTLKAKVGKAKKRKKVAVTIRATAPSVTVPGKVKVTYAGKGIGTVTLKNGKASIRLPGKKKGSYKLVLSYAGATGFDTAKRSVTVKVR